MPRLYLIISIAFSFTGATELLSVSPDSQDPRAGKLADSSLALEFLRRAELLYEESDYDSLPYYYETAAALFRGAGKHEKAVQGMLGMVDYHRIIGQQAAATRRLESTEDYIRSNIGMYSESWADALFVRGKLYYGKNLSREAIHSLRDCLELHRRLGSGPGKLAGVYNVMGSSYFSLGDTDSAELNYFRSYRMYNALTMDPTPEKGTILYNISLIYSRRNDLKKWAEYTLRSIENNTALFGPDYPDLARAYNSLSSYFITRGKLDSARHYLDRAEAIMVNSFGEDYHELIRIYINRARIYGFEGDYNAALEYYAQAERILLSQEVPLLNLERVVYVNTGHIYRSTGQYETAHRYLLKILRQEGKVHPSHMASVYAYLADIQIKLGEFEKAEGNLKKTFDLRGSYFPGNYYGRIYDYTTLATLFDSTGRYGEAGNYYRKAISQSLESYGRYHFRTAQAYTRLGDHFLMQNRDNLALEQYQQAIQSLVRADKMDGRKPNPDPRDVSNPMHYLRILRQKCTALERLSGIGGKEDTVFVRALFEASRTAVMVTEFLRNSYLNQESKLFLSTNERLAYEQGVRSAYRCFRIFSDPGYLKQAFMIAEKGKYAALKSVLDREEALVLSGIPDSIIVLEAELNKRLSVYQELLLESGLDTLPDQAILQEFQTEVFRLKNRIARLHQSLESDYPEYYDLLYNPASVDPDKLSARMNRRDRILEYFIAGHELYIFEIVRDGLHCHVDTMDASFYKDLDRIQTYLTGRSIYDSRQDDHLSFLVSAHRLYKRLIPPESGNSNLVIIPEGPLSYLAFDILVTEPVEHFTGLFRDVPFLIVDHSIRYGYSATLLAGQRHRSPGNLNRYLGFAPGYLAGNNRKHLDPLTASIDEVTRVADLLGGISFTGQDASEGRFRDMAGRSHILHLATHAFLDDRDPLRSTLVFSEDPKREEDGFLYVYELYNMDLKARLAVLSACNTGSGEMHGGEGIISLARAFFYAGVPNIVMTLWTVSDQHGFELMLSFYKHLARGRKAEHSLRKSKLDYLRSAGPGYQHPRYWSGYILVGNPEYLFFPRYYRQMIATAGFLVLLIVILFMRRRYRAGFS